MTKWLWLFFVFYLLVGQPAMLWWMQDDNSFYRIAWVNAWVFFIAWIISALLKSSNKNLDSKSITSQLLWENAEDNTWSEVSVVKVQETTVKEIEVAKVDINQETPKLQESLEDDNKEQNIQKSEWAGNQEKTMKEWVTIPKIVQPLWAAWHSVTKKKRKKEVSYGQWVVMLVTLMVAWVIAYTLWEFLENWWIAIALFLWWILYLIIWKLFDINGFYAARKLFTNWLYVLMILAWIWYWIYSMQKEGLASFLPQNWADRISSYTSGLLDVDWDSDTDDNTWAIYLFEWTGEVITDTWDIVLDSTWDIEAQTWIIENTVWIDTWIIENAEPVVDAQNIEPEVVAQPEPVAEPVPTSEDLDREVTRWEAIKHLLQWYTLSKKTDKSFTYVAKSNELYPYFKTAHEKAMIWTDVNPNKRISCETYMALKWILERWSVNIYDRSQTRVIYWNKANELGKTNGCGRWWFVKVKNL